MSIENLAEYIRQVDADPEKRARAREIGLDNIEGQMAFARSLSLEWDEADFEALARQAQKWKSGEGSGELSDEDLELVAGGVTVSPLASAELGLWAAYRDGGAQNHW